ncbi:MAG: HD-GYP domain-containing protein [Planctomycetota bacterium]|nr:HD-GYP domain-containing protein [Planctomycetota bacterium]
MTTQLVRPALPERLGQRLEALGVSLVWLDGDGRAQPVGAASGFERLVVESPVFAASIRRLWPQLALGSGAALEVWPGLWLTHLPIHRRRRAGLDPFKPPLLAAVFLGAELLGSDQLHAVCDAARVDHRATVDRVDPAILVSAAEARRLAMSLAWLQQDGLEMDRRHGELHNLSQQLGESYEELSLLYKLSSSMTVNQPPAHFLTDACRDLQQVLGLKWIALQLTDTEPRLNELAGQVITAGPVGCAPDRLKEIGKRLMSARPVANRSWVVDDTTTLAIPHLRDIASHLLVVTLDRGGQPAGILFGGDKLDGSHISSIDSKLCGSLANSLAIFLENMMLYEDMQSMFMGVLHALTSSIDAKDSYTHGHSERVALLSQQLAIAAGLPAEQVERVYISGLIHDVGKIGVPEAVLCKPGQLTAEEFGLIKLHPQIGARILQDIRQMQDLIPGVLYHHERWDGRGYPFGAAGADIPLFGRLICLADSFDAMSSNRTYRQAMRLEQVLSEISRCAGKQFDP